MPSFVRVGRTEVNTDHIVSVEPRSRGASGAIYAVTLSDGRTIESRDDPSDSIGTIIPAPPGLVLVEAFPPRPSDTDRTVDYFATAVIAFRLVGRETPIPIGIDGEPSPENQSVVIQPDGQCIGWGATWDSLEAFKASQQSKAEQQANADTPPDPLRLTVSARATEERAPTAPPATRDRLEQAEAPPAAPKTVDQFRARILAEPIRVLIPNAPWRADRDLAEVIAAVRDANPDLHTSGVGHRAAWGWKWKPGDQERARAEMTSPGCVEEFERALRFLSYAAGRFPSVKVNHRRTSYSWKHAAERVMGGYVSNGMLVAAAYALGFKVATDPESPNPCINLGEKAAGLDPQRGL